MREGVRPNSFWGDRVRQTIAKQVDSIRHWKIYNCDYSACPVSGSATWFIDPPYEVAGEYYRHGSDQIDYAELGKWCRSRVGQIVVCENAGAAWLPFKPLANVKTTRANSHSREVLWVRSTAVPTIEPQIRDDKANGHKANGHKANGHKANGHQANDHKANGNGRNESTPKSQSKIKATQDESRRVSASG